MWIAFRQPDANIQDRKMFREGRLQDIRVLVPRSYEQSSKFHSESGDVASPHDPFSPIYRRPDSSPSCSSYTSDSRTSQSGLRLCNLSDLILNTWRAKMLFLTKFTAALTATTQSRGSFKFMAQHRPVPVEKENWHGVDWGTKKEGWRHRPSFPVILLHLVDSDFNPRLSACVAQEGAHAICSAGEIDSSHCFLFSLARSPLNIPQLALSGDTVGSISMKDDDGENLGGEVWKVREAPWDGFQRPDRESSSKETNSRRKWYRISLNSVTAGRGDSWTWCGWGLFWLSVSHVSSHLLFCSPSSPSIITSQMQPKCSTKPERVSKRRETYFGPHTGNRSCLNKMKDEELGARHWPVSTTWFYMF